MWSLLKFLVFLTLIAVFLWFGTHVKMGQYTLFGHLARIWNTPEAQDLVKGVREGSGPAIDKVKRGVEAGVKEATRTDGDAGPAAPSAAKTPPPSATPTAHAPPAPAENPPATPAAHPPATPAVDAGAAPAKHTPRKKKHAVAGT